jgi:iron-sulfur cluster assembly accessory protein
MMTLAEQTQTEVITLTPAAAMAVQDLLQQRNLKGYALRVFVQGGGCSGLQYGMALESNIRDQDLSAEFDGVKVVVDEISIDYLRGSTVDYVDGPEGSGFKIENPNPMPSSCSCNSSSASGGCSGCG